MEVRKKIKFQKYCFRTLFVLLCVCSIPAHAAFKTEDYFPINRNPNFTYQINGGPTTNVITVQPGTTLVNSIPTKRVNYSLDGSSEYYSNDTSGLFLHRVYGPDPDVGYLNATFSPPAKLAEADMNVGQTISDNTSVTLDTGIGPFSFNLSSSTQINAVEQVTVPLGTYTALKITVTYTLSGTIFETPVSETTQNRYWLVEHLGPVKIEDLITGDLSELIVVDSDGDGQINTIDTDDDNDGTPDVSDAFPLDPDEDTDTDNDGIGNNADDDDDGDGTLDINDTFPLDATETTDTDGDGIGDNADTAFNIPNTNVAVLIASINAANDEVNNPGLDVIELATNGSYTLTSTNNTDNGNTGLPTITSNLIIKGNGASILAGPDNNPCDGSGDEFRIFLINATGTLTLNNMTVSDGCTFGVEGGSILVEGGSLNLNNSSVLDNNGQPDGGVYNNAGRVSVSR
jgi:hypothetical protein